MIQNSLSKAFTLIEVMVWIAIIGIIAYGVSQFDFRAVSQRSQVEIDVSKLVNNFEEIRNNALVGKAVFNSGQLENPEAWRMTLTSTWTFAADYSLSGDFSTSSINYDILSWNERVPASILSLECRRINHASPLTISNGWTSIEFRWPDIELRCNNSTYDSKDKLLVIEYGTPSISKTITINTLSGVIEVD